MMITQLEGKVSLGKIDVLKEAFDKALKQLPSAIESSYLVQNTTDTDLWRIITIWKSEEALQSYRQSVETPEGILMFREAGSEPVLLVSQVISHT